MNVQRLSLEPEFVPVLPDAERQGGVAVAGTLLRGLGGVDGYLVYVLEPAVMACRGSGCSSSRMGAGWAREGPFSDVFECCCVSVSLGDPLVNNRFRLLRISEFHYYSNYVVVVMFSMFYGTVRFCGLR